MSRPSRSTGRSFRDKAVHAELKKLPGVTPVSDGGGIEWFRVFDRGREVRLQQRGAGDDVHQGPRQELRTQGRAESKRSTLPMLISPKRWPTASSPGSCGTRRCGSARRSPHITWRKRRDAKRILVVTYKPAVEDAWDTDATTHTDFDGWEFFSRASTTDPATFAPDTTVVCFCSLQDLRGRDRRRLDQGAPRVDLCHPSGTS